MKNFLRNTGSKETRNEILDSLIHGFLISLLFGGCSSNAETPGRSTLNPQLSTLPPAPLPSSALRVPSSAFTLLSVLPPPAAAGLEFTFAYRMPLTNGFLQSSTDLVHWETRDDYVIETNIVDGTNHVRWSLPRDPAKPREFYRAGGEMIL